MYYEYYQYKGHKTLNCVNLSHKIQDLIDDGDVVVDGHNKNVDHKAFKEQFPSYDNGESSKSEPQNKVNYTYSNVINMVEPIGMEYCYDITIKGK